MIPIKLTMRNFMCYREDAPPLSFAGIHTACVSGDNGNGKSALIDAITWALWGEARAKSHTDLITQGQSEMSVEFDFAIGDQIYRVIRKYARPKIRTGSGHPVLEFQAKNGDLFRSETGNTISQTQQKIINTLHMDYDTFINSAFLRQGHADEFTNREPGRRKEVLASILGLSRYDIIEAKARESMKIWGDLTINLQNSIHEIISELEQKPASEDSITKAGETLEKCEKQVREHEVLITGMKTNYDGLVIKQGQKDQLEKHKAEIEKAVKTWVVQINKHKDSIAGNQGLLGKKNEIVASYSRLSESRKIHEDLNNKLSQLMKWNERKNRLEMIIERAKSELLREHAVTQRNIADLKSKADKLAGLKEEMQNLEAQQNKLSEAETGLEEKRKAFLGMRSVLGKTESDTAYIQQQIKEIDEKLAMLGESGGTVCPLCEQTLGEDEHLKIAEKYNDEKKAKQELFHSCRKELADRRTEVAGLEKDITGLEQKLKRERITIQTRLGQVHSNFSEATAGVEGLNLEQAHLSEVELRLAKNDFAANEQQALSAVVTEISVLEYSPKKHEEVRHRLEELAGYDELKLRLAEAERSIEGENESLTRAENNLSELNNTLHNINLNLQDLAAELGILPQLSTDYKSAESEHKILLAEEGIARETLIRAREKLKYFDGMETKKSEKEKQLSRAIEQGKIYQELSQSFGKKGIQAMLIETAIPEIELEADNLLSKMTDNRMHVKIETQRETKKGDVSETLDIMISDELGTRGYELFSGGEAFRINFAIRIALSKLLAHRAGAPLPTLIIDEGFGTQDSTGIDKLKEAINSIQNDFEKIFVITHIEEFKDAFQARIDVTKTGDGAKAEVSG